MTNGSFAEIDLQLKTFYVFPFLMSDSGKHLAAGHSNHRLPKLQVSCRKRAIHYRALLKKMIYIRLQNTHQIQGGEDA